EALSNPRRPFVVILGGAKVSDKIQVIENLLKSADAVLIGGAMAYTFLKARGVNLQLPVDHVVAAGPDDGANAENVSVEATPADKMGLDIGEATQKDYGDIIASAQTIIWNGPMGMFEKPP